MFIRYTTPSDLPCYGDWDFRVYPGVFELDLIAIRERLARNRVNMPSHWPDLKHANACIAELDRLTALNNAGEVIELNDYLSEGLWITAGSLIRTKQFRTAFCPECKQAFPPSEISNHTWLFGSGLAASGGNRYECPGGHTLYSLEAWNS